MVILNAVCKRTTPNKKVEITVNIVIWVNYCIINYYIINY